MAYTVKEVAKISGVSVRTLHHYDEVDLLKPAFYGSNGYRYYEEGSGELRHTRENLYLQCKLLHMI